MSRFAHRTQRVLPPSVVYSTAVKAYPGTTHNQQDELAPHEADCGKTGCFRTYSSTSCTSSFTWAGEPGTTFPGWQTWWSWHSFKGDTVSVASGSYNTTITAFVNSIPVTGYKRLLTYWHEPENDTIGFRNSSSKFTALQWKQAAYQFGLAVRAANHPDVLYGPIFMSKFTLDECDQLIAADSNDLSSVCDFIGFDPYNEASRNGDYSASKQSAVYYLDDTSTSSTISTGTNSLKQWANTYFPNKPLAFGETGYVANLADLSMRPAWLQKLVAWNAQNNVLCCCYYDSSAGKDIWLRIYNDGSNPSYVYNNSPAPYQPDPQTIALWRTVYSNHPVPKGYGG